MICAIDCETTGKLNWRRPFTDPGQPRVVSIGMVAWNDEGTQEVGNLYSIIKPENFQIINSSEACQINGITQEIAMECGIPIKTALSALDQWVYKAKYCVFFNAEFDVAMLTGEASLIQRPCQFKKERTRCMKEAYTELCHLPGGFGGDYKWPKLEEAYEWAYGGKPEGAHNALADARTAGWLAFTAVEQDWWRWNVGDPAYVASGPVVAPAKEEEDDVRWDFSKP
jgi:hypothetical protein